MTNEELSQFVIATEEELKILFINEIEREVFKTIITRIVEVITKRTSLTGLKFHLI